MKSVLFGFPNNYFVREPLGRLSPSPTSYGLSSPWKYYWLRLLLIPLMHHLKDPFWIESERNQLISYILSFFLQIVE